MNRPVLVFDFGSQYVQLIARRCRERRAFAMVVRHDLSVERVRELDPLAIILSGGPASVYEAAAPRCDPKIFDLGVPVSGPLLRHATRLRGARRQGAARSRRRVRSDRVPLDRADRRNLSRRSRLVDRLEQPRRSSSRGRLRVHFFGRDGDLSDRRREASRRPVYGLQFHPEVAHTPYGALILGNFLDRVCKSAGLWTMSAFLDCAVDEIRERVARDDRVVCGFSGGVDSAVAAALLAKALGSRVVCVFVDNGLLRLGERESVAQAFGEHSDAELRVVDVRDLFLNCAQRSRRSARKTSENRPYVYRCFQTRGEVDPGLRVISRKERFIPT